MKVHRGYLEDMGACVSINGTEDVIKEVDITVLVQSARELNSLLLATTHVDAPLTNLGLITKLHLGEIVLQCAPFQSVLVFGSVHRTTKQNILFNCGVLNPR
jgi:hypothetical protein